jgi:tetrahydromethanopterin S-methyltransferase subunit B
MDSYLRGFPKENIEQIGKEVYERNLESLPATKVSDLVTTYFFQGIVIGAFISIILAIILRRTT